MRSTTLPILACLLTCTVAAVTVEPSSIYIRKLGDDPFSYPGWGNTYYWEEETAPPADGTATVFFPGPVGEDFERFQASIDVNETVDLAAMIFGEQVDYSFYSWESATVRVRDLLRIASSEYPSSVYFDWGITFLTDQSGLKVEVGYGAEIEINGAFYNDVESEVEVTGGGLFLLSGDNSHGNLNGLIQITEGYLGLGQDTAAGDALISLGDPENPGSNTAGIIAVDGDRSIQNSVLVHGSLETSPDHHDRHELNFEGEVTFTSNTQINNYGGLLEFTGGVAETSTGTRLDIWTEEPVIFSGPTGLTGGINLQDGVVLFADQGALPEGSPGTFLTSSSDSAYIGLLIENSEERYNATLAFLDLFDRAKFTGTIGFDTDPFLTGPANAYTAPLDLTGFTGARIGSVTQAEILGEITPSGQDYLFGNGGGTLQVGSLLEDADVLVEPTVGTGGYAAASPARGVDSVSEPDEPLTVYLNNPENSFSGSVTATHSAIIFGNAPGTLPTTATLMPGNGGYIGLQDATRSIAAYLSQFDPGLETGVIGFDSPDRQTNRVISDTIDLSSFTSSQPDFYLGTSTWVNLASTIILPAGATDYRFAGFKGGSLNVTSLLSDGDGVLGVVIGDQNSPATHGHEYPGSAEENAVLSSVRLEGVNTYSGGTRFEAGELVITNSASLGTGPLTVEGNFEGGFTSAITYGFFNEYAGDGFDFLTPVLRPDVSDLVLTNPIHVNSFLEVDVQIALTDENLTLAGDISGTGGIDKNGSGTLTLSGHNANFSGGLYITEGTVNIDGDTSAGTGPVGFGGSGGSGQYLVFNSMNPTIGGLYEIRDFEDYYHYYSYASVMLATGSTLTIDINGFDLDFGGSIMGDGAVRLEGQGVQKLSGFNSFTGGIQLAEGANLVVSDSGSLGQSHPNPPSVTLDGGSLTLDLRGEVRSIEANVLFGAQGGEIRGNGGLIFDTPLLIGEGISIAAGLSVGRLDFEGPLELGELGSLNVEIGDSGTDEIIADVVFADTIDLTASPAAPFSINLMGENGELPTNFDPMQAYAWSVLLAGSAITNFDAMAFNLNVSSALNTLGGEGLWSLSLASSGTAFSESFLSNNVVQLSFTPVPEPSTFALVALGLAWVTFQAGRRRRASR